MRAEFPQVPDRLGGASRPTVPEAATLNAPYVDYAVRGQGEETFAGAAQALGHGHPDSDALVVTPG